MRADEPANPRACSLQKHFKVNQFDELMHGKYREHLFRYSVHVPDAIRLDLAAEEVAQKGKGRGGVPTFFTREEDQAPAGIGAIRLVNATGEVNAAVFRSQLQAHSSAQVIRIESLYDLEVRLNVIQDDIFEVIWKHASA